MPTATGAITDVTDQTFADQVLGSDVPVLVEFWAQWCSPCRMLRPVLAEIAVEYAGTLRVAKVNIDEQTGTARDAQVMAAPTMHVYVRGELVKRMVGATSKARLTEQLEPYLAC